MASGQFLLNFGSIDGFIPFIIVAILCSLSVVPLAITKVGNPPIEKPSVLNIFELIELSRSGFISCFVAGLLLSITLTFFPIYINDRINDVSNTAFVMFLVLAGGMCLQYPIGRLSDIVDRRKVIVALCCVITVISAYITTLHVDNALLFYFFMFAIGGAIATVYPLSISLACDMLEPEDIVAGTQGLMLIYGLGAACGPIVVTLFIGAFDIEGIFTFFVLICAALGLYLVKRIITTPAHTTEEHQNFVNVPNTTPIAAELDPRSEEE